jgi:hypothetical protein
MYLIIFIYFLIFRSMKFTKCDTIPTTTQFLVPTAKFLICSTLHQLPHRHPFPIWKCHSFAKYAVCHLRLKKLWKFTWKWNICHRHSSINVHRARKSSHQQLPS